MGIKPDSLSASVLKVCIEMVDWQTAEGGKPHEASHRFRFELDYAYP